MVCQRNTKIVAVETLSVKLHNEAVMISLLHDFNDELLAVFGDKLTTLPIPESKIVFTKQVHGDIIRVVSKNDCGNIDESNRIHCDGLITNDTDVALHIVTADCVPILLYDPIGKVIGALHAGWRGTVAEISKKAVLLMQSEYNCNPSDIIASIGPAISKCCYEVDYDVANAVHKCVFKIYPLAGNKFIVDLKEANEILLSRAGVTNIEVSDICTSCNSNKYWSHRATSGKRKTQFSLISMIR